MTAPHTASGPHNAPDASNHIALAENAIAPVAPVSGALRGVS
jgi:hypothetical protein